MHHALVLSLFHNGPEDTEPPGAATKASYRSSVRFPLVAKFLSKKQTLERL